MVNQECVTLVIRGSWGFENSETDSRERTERDLPRYLLALRDKCSIETFNSSRSTWIPLNFCYFGKVSFFRSILIINEFYMQHTIVHTNYPRSAFFGDNYESQREYFEGSLFCSQIWVIFIRFTVHENIRNWFAIPKGNVFYGIAKLRIVEPNWMVRGPRIPWMHGNNI